MIACKKLSLSTNCIEKMITIAGLRNLEILSLGRNQLKKIQGLEEVGQTLKELWISYNQIEKLDGLTQCIHLHTLFISNNKIKVWDEVGRLAQLPELRNVLFVGNPIYEDVRVDPRVQVIRRCPQIEVLDTHLVTEQTRRITFRVTKWPFKGILGRVWLAAHCEHKLTKANVIAHSISDSVLAVKDSKTVMALRISGHLLLGVAKLYLSKAVFLGEEVTEALQQLSQGFESVEVLPNSGVATVKVKKSAAQVSSLQELTEHTSLKPTREVLPEIVAPKEAITMGDHEYTPLALQLRGDSHLPDHIETSDHFLSDLNEIFRIDTIAPQEPMQVEPQQPIPPVPQQSEPLDAEEETNPLMDLDFTIREDPPKRKPRQKKEVVREEEEEEEVKTLEAREEDADEVVLPQPSPEPETAPAAAPADQPQTQPPAEPEKKGFRKLKRAWVQDEESVLPDYEQVADLDSTSDIVRNPIFLSERSSKIAPEFEKLLFVPVIDGMTKELSDFYTSTHKILKLKNALRDAEAPEVPPAEEEPASPQMKTATVKEPVPVVPMEMEPEMPPVVKEEPLPEEAKAGEEEWSERSKRMLQLLTLRLTGVGTLLYSDLSKNKDAKTTSCGFYELLVLARRDYVELTQTEGLGELTIKPGRNMHL